MDNSTTDRTENIPTIIQITAIAFSSKYSLNKRYPLKFSLFFKNKCRYRRIVPAVVIFVHDHCVVSCRKLLQKRQNPVFFFKSGVASAVNTQAHHSAALQNIQTFLNSSQTSPGRCGDTVVTTRKLPEIKTDHVCGQWFCIQIHVFMTIFYKTYSV